MGLRTQLLGSLIRKQFEEHSDELRAEVDRVKSIRSVADAKTYAAEKGGEAKEMWREHGPAVKSAVRREWERLRKRWQDDDGSR
ncbi:hypothetical protein GGQ74_001256 [Desulfobaculum xiamenense]|uniref:Uncharacterized protein n=1 Tax=Desulfobaculum xiamenense TaxID=995050 RepID=A0A846QFP8_9BACT|nr:hypothetical protein [Desulfobaculum xiamenense]NJB67616.1 hypothetical protein [Desulfobaculum xiamenense]